MTRHLTRVAAAGLALCAINALAANDHPTPDLAELWKIIQRQQAEIESLRGELKGTRQQVSRAEEKIAATGDMVEQALPRGGDGHGAGGTSIGGYGEVHYNNLELGNGDEIDEIDLHRFVLFFGHEFTDRLRLVSELEVEHGGVEADGSPLDGEVELEQAYVEYDISDHHSVKGGVFLVPTGLLNETHEPTTFYGVERNPVENVIIPATWWEAGAAVTGRRDSGLSYDLALHSGLQIPTSGSSAFRIRSGRQKVSEASADEPAVTGRVRYTGVPGLELAASLQYQSDITQVSGDGADEAILLATHAVWNRGPFTAKALYARWDIDGDAIEAADGDRQDGYYVEASYKLNPQVGVFGRYNEVDGVRVQDEFDQVDVGVNWWPHEDVVIKADYVNRRNDNDSDRDIEGFNLGIGYQF